MGDGAFNSLTGTLLYTIGGLNTSSIIEAQLEPRELLSVLELEARHLGIGLIGERLFTSSPENPVIVERDPVTGLVINSFPSPGGPASAITGTFVPEPDAAVLMWIAVALLRIRRLRKQVIRE